MDTDKKLLTIPAILVLTFIAVFVVMALVTDSVARASRDGDTAAAFERVRETIDNAIIALSIIVMLSLLSVLVMAYVVFWALQEEHRGAQRAKAQFFSMITHELRSPITPIKAEVQMLLDGYVGKLTPKQRRSLQTVLRNSDRLDALIGDLVDATKLQSEQLRMEAKPFDLRKEMATALSDMEALLPERRVRIAFEAGALPTVEADPARIMQVVRNLVGNAKKYAPQGSTVTVRATTTENGVEVSVHDCGPGISAEKRPHVFEPFFQGSPEVSKQYGGTGLGLVICRGIVQAHGGRMWFESVEGNGTTFFFTLPSRKTNPA